ncbi:MAG TPA: TonB-dependent receptor [Azospirillaceae bacterium]|nr:TonB-dependent receptor [Azospirillaceae bacterium]
MTIRATGTPLPVLLLLGVSASALLAAPVAAPARAQQVSAEAPILGAVRGEVVVIGVAPSGAGVPLERVPANVQTLSSREIDRPGAASLSDSLARRLGSVSAVDTLGNPLQQGITLRGFTAAPALGEPQGVAVHQGAMRVNESFGDVVQWDLLPVFAIHSVQVVPGSNPTYGPNAIGGSVELTMKDGFRAPGMRGEVSAGSHGRRSIIAETGGRAGAVGFYAGADWVRDRGWRDRSPSRVRRAHGDLSWRGAASEVGLALTGAASELSGNGPAPADLLAEERDAVFTYPDRTDSRLFAASARGVHEIAAGLTVQGGAYFRRLKRSTVNGDQAEFEECGEFAGLVPGFDPPEGALCFGAEVEGDGPAVEGDPEVLLDAGGRPLLDFGGAEPDAVFNRTRTRTGSGGAGGQLVWAGAVAGRGNVLVLGATADHARTSYASGSDLGVLGEDRGVEDLGIGIGNDAFNVGLRTRSTLLGAYVSDTYSLTPALHLSGALRLNHADLELRDQIGTDLDGDHSYTRLNPGLGAAWNAAPALTLYATYNESNRIPTPAELSCADPEKPCRFPNAFLADPPLDDVVARTVEAGLRGDGRLGGMGWDWSAAAFRTRNSDDIIFISAGPIIGTGYFDNVGGTERRGVELAARGEAGRFSWYASYALVDARFRSRFAIQAPDNPEADEDGEIRVEPGDTIPGVPLHSLKLGGEVTVTPALRLGAELVANSGRRLRGDEANLTEAIDGFALVNLEASYRIGAAELFGRVDNVLGTRYETFGLYGEAGELGFMDPRFLSPGAPRSVTVGLKARF